MRIKSVFASLTLFLAACVACAQDMVVYHFDNALAQGLKGLRQHLGVEAVHRLGKHSQKCVSIRVVNKDRFAPVTSRSNVVDRTGDFDSQWAGHARRLCG